MKTVRAELADALRILNARYRELPNPEIVDLFTDEILDLETQIGAALAAGDDPAARRAIRLWRDRHLTNFQKARDA